MVHCEQYEVNAIFDVNEPGIHLARTNQWRAAAKIFNDLFAKSYGAGSINAARANDGGRQAVGYGCPNAPLRSNLRGIIGKAAVAEWRRLVEAVAIGVAINVGGA